MTIKLIALDLDGTTLTTDKRMTTRTEKALLSAMEMGTHVVIATGRVLSALPEEILSVKGIEYAITSNGAKITRLKDRYSIYSNCIDKDAAEEVINILRKTQFMVEAFVENEAFVEREIYDNIQDIGLSEIHTKYVLSTRKPIADLFGYMERKSDIIENININFGNQEDRARMRDVMLKVKNITVTTSFDHNIEVGGANTSKAEAILELCRNFGIKKEEVMACGDSLNDIEMLKIAGLPVAMENGKAEIKALAKYVTDTNDNDGVAKAIEKFVL